MPRFADLLPYVYIAVIYGAIVWCAVLLYRGMPEKTATQQAIDEDDSAGQ